MEQDQLSRILQQSLSPVHAAIQVPQPMPNMMTPGQASYMYGMPNVPFAGGMMAPGAPSPHYRPEYDMGAGIMNFAKAQMSRGAMLNDARQRSPFSWAGDQGSSMHVDPMSKRIAASEELAIRDSSAYGFQGMMGLGTSQGVMNWATTAATLPMGLLPGLGVGLAANFMGGAVDRTVFSGARDMRRAGMMLRSSLNMGNLGSAFGMDETGVMNHEMAQTVANKVSRLAQGDSRFDGKQFLQMTDRMAQSGMLQGVQSSDEIVNRVKMVSKNLKTFMKIANEPDVLNALKEMANLRNMGIADANLTQAASNARAFARMAGVSRPAMQQAGMQTAQMYQQQGLSTAAGYQMGMLTHGLAAQNVSRFSRGLQQAMGGAAGIGQAMAAGVAGAQRHTTMDMLMHSIFQSKGGGQFGLDVNALNKFMGGGDLAKMFDAKSRDLNASGNLMQHIQDMNERKPELREALQQRLGSSGMMLLTLRQAQAMQRVSGGKMTLFSALQRVSGSDQSARALSRIATSPDAMQNLVENMQHEQRRRSLADRDEIMYSASLGSRLTKRLRSATDFGFSRYVASFNASRSQELRDQAMGVYGRDRRADALMTTNSQQRKEVLDAIIAGRGPAAPGSLRDLVGEGNVGVPSFSVDPMANLTGFGLRSRMAAEFSGYGTGLGGRMQRGLTRTAKFFGTNRIFMGLGATDLDAMSEKEIFRRAVEAGEIGSMAMMGDTRSLTGAASALQGASESFFAGTNLSAKQRSAVFGAGSKALANTFNQRKGSLFSDASIDFDATRAAIRKQLIDAGLSPEDADKRLSGEEGKKYMAAMLRSRLATRSKWDYDRDRAQVNDHQKLGGMGFGGAQERLVDSVRGLTGLSGRAVFGDTLHSLQGTELSREQTMDLMGMMGGVANTKDEMADATKIMQLLSQQERGTTPEKLQEQMASLYAGKSPEQRKRLNQMFKQLETKFRGSSDKDVFSRMFTDEKFDAGAFSKAMGGSLKGIRQLAFHRQARRRIKEDFGIEIGSGKSFLQEMLKKGEDSSFITNLKEKGGESAQLATMLQDARDGGEDEKRNLADFLVGKGRTRTGVTGVGGPSDPIAKRQMEMARGLQNFAAQNARNTSAFGTTVDRMTSLIGKSRSGSSLGAVVDDFKEAVDKFSSAAVIRK